MIFNHKFTNSDLAFNITIHIMRKGKAILKFINRSPRMNMLLYINCTFLNVQLFRPLLLSSILSSFMHTKHEYLLNYIVTSTNISNGITHLIRDIHGLRLNSSTYRIQKPLTVGKAERVEKEKII